jgi:hypothetical protein
MIEIKCEFGTFIIDELRRIKTDSEEIHDAHLYALGAPYSPDEGPPELAVANKMKPFFREWEVLGEEYNTRDDITY